MLTFAEKEAGLSKFLDVIRYHHSPIIAIHLVPTQLTGGLELSIGLSQAIFKHELTQAEYEAKLVSRLKMPFGEGVLCEFLILK